MIFRAVTFQLKNTGVLPDKMNEIEVLRQENKKLKKYISLLLAEIEFSQRVQEIRENYPTKDESDRLVEPILRRLSRIRNERLDIESELDVFD